MSIDELSSVRYLHASSVRSIAAPFLSESEADAFAAYVYSDAYAARLGDNVRAGRLLAACLPDNKELLATAGWVPANDSGALVRMTGIFTSPLFAGMGLGRLVMEAAERQATDAGYSGFSVRCPVAAAGFFARLGFEVASHGVWPLTRDDALQVAFLRKLTGPVLEG